MSAHAIDRFVAAAGLVLGGPVLALSALGIKSFSPGPILYRAPRAGINGETFTIFKLRTMHTGSEQRGRISSHEDPRVFAWGGVLRRLKIDELPQLFNVLRGEMTLVGPRPEDVTIVREHYDDMMWESLSVPPGITSPGSLHYFALESELPSDPRAAEQVYLDRLLPAKIALDLVYVRHRTSRYQLELLLRTALGIVGLGWLFSARADWERAQAALILKGSGR